MKSYQGRSAAITGAGSGMGRALALKLAQSGCHLALCDVDEAGLQATADTLPDSGIKVITQAVDVSDEAQVQAWAKTAIDTHGQVDLVINNAGVGMTMPIMEMSSDDLQWIMSINFLGVVNGCKAFLPHLLTLPRANLCNMSSVFGLFTAPNAGGYCASKAAVRAYTQTLAQELADSPVTVSCAYPGGIRTNMARNTRLHAAASEADHAENIRRFEQDIAKTSADKAADIILDGIQRGRERILVGTDAQIFDRGARWLPGSWQWLVRKQMDKNR